MSSRKKNIQADSGTGSLHNNSEVKLKKARCEEAPQAIPQDAMEFNDERVGTSLGTVESLTSAQEDSSGHAAQNRELLLQEDKSTPLWSGTIGGGNITGNQQIEEFPQLIPSLMKNAGLTAEQSQDIVGQLVNKRFGNERRLLLSVQHCITEGMMVERFLKFNFEPGDASALAAAVEAIRGPMESQSSAGARQRGHLPRSPLTAKDLKDLIENTQLNTNDPLIQLVHALGGEGFVHLSDSPLRFARHQFEHDGVDQTPAAVAELREDWARRLSHIGKGTVDLKHINTLDAVAASPGSGKSHFQDMLANHLVQHPIAGNQMIYRVTFASLWTYVELEENWTVEQQFIGRLLAIACQSTNWEAFAAWFQSIPLFHTELAVLIDGLFPAPCVVVFLVDELLLIRQEEDDYNSVAGLCGLLCHLGDKLFLKGSLLLSLFTSLHTAYFISRLTLTGRTICYYCTDTVKPKEIIKPDLWTSLGVTHGENVVDALFSMCIGHPRSVAIIKEALQEWRYEKDNVVCYIDGIFSKIIAQRYGAVLSRYCTMEYCCPIFLDLEVPGTMRQDDGLSAGARATFAGFYTNIFQQATSAKFVPVTTVLYLLWLFIEHGENPKDMPMQSYQHSLLMLRKSLLDSRPERLDEVLARLLHIRYHAMCVAVTVLPDVFGAAAPMLQLINTGTSLSSRSVVGLINVEQSQLHDVPAFLRNAKLLAMESFYYKPWEFPNIDYEENLNLNDCTITKIIRPANPTNPAVDDGLQCFCKTADGDTDFETCLFLQNKQAMRGHLSKGNVRKWIYKLEQKADNYLTRRRKCSSLRQVVVLVLVLCCTDPNDIQIAKVVGRCAFNDVYQYRVKTKKYTIPATRYPIILLGRRNVYNLLGKHFASYLRDRLWGLECDTVREPEEDDDIPHELIPEGEDIVYAKMKNLR